jgi:uncharacterized Tic20 family protein
MTDRVATPDGVSPSSGTDTPDGDTTLAALAHASALVASFLGPLLILVLAEDELAERNAKSSLNFQIVTVVALFVSGLLTTVLVGLLLFPAVLLIDVALVLVATVRANDGEIYSYPLTPDLL